MRATIRAAILALAATLVLTGCDAKGGQGGTPIGGGGVKHADTPKIPIKFTVINDVDVLVTYNLGHGDKYHDLIPAPGDNWTEGTEVGQTVSINASPGRKQGTISVKIENGNTGKLICHGTNFHTTDPGAKCSGKAK